MKKVSLLLLLCSIFLAGCHNKEEPPDEIKKPDPNEYIQWFVDKEEIPQWLADEINRYETMYAPKASLAKVIVFRREWKGQTIYNIYEIYSYIGPRMHYENGEYVNLSNIDDTEKNIFYTEGWKVIYEFGGFPGTFHKENSIYP
ncbi:MAG: hypothetical protein LBF62_00335 [Tannerellaceae bacterium]|jgi:hypothetical protein|nr:hypothetical protein [Tannerellaceae bacterium]